MTRPSDVMSVPERLFGDEAYELMRVYGDEFVINEEGTRVFHSCGWVRPIEGHSAWAVRGIVLRHLRIDHHLPEARDGA